MHKFINLIIVDCSHLIDHYSDKVINYYTYIIITTLVFY